MTENPLVLLVVEDATLAEVTGYRLHLLGYDVRLATSGDEALQLVKSEQPDAIIVQMEIGGLGGLALIEAISRDEATTKIPMLSLSADAELDSVQRAFRAGAVDYLVTPYNPLVLEAKVEQLVALAGKAV